MKMTRLWPPQKCTAVKMLRKTAMTGESPLLKWKMCLNAVRREWAVRDIGA